MDIKNHIMSIKEAIRVTLNIWQMVLGIPIIWAALISLWPLFTITFCLIIEKTSEKINK